MEKKKVEIEKVNRIAKMYHYNKKGFSNVKISRLLGIHRNTVISDLKKEPTEAVNKWNPYRIGKKIGSLNRKTQNNNFLTM